MAWLAGFQASETELAPWLVILRLSTDPGWAALQTCGEAGVVLPFEPEPELPLEEVEPDPELVVPPGVELGLGLGVTDGLGVGLGLAP